MYSDVNKVGWNPYYTTFVKCPWIKEKCNCITSEYRKFPPTIIRGAKATNWKLEMSDFTL